ncbi:MAG: hypothetical protein CMJ78_23300 [Planctomycetaceae bacterium]|nr:hypothetical protein [Planctomycetaceae bacterium]
MDEPQVFSVEAALLDDELSLSQRWFYLVTYWLSGKEKDLTRIYDLSIRSMEHQDSLFDALTYEVLTTPDFFEMVQVPDVDQFKKETKDTKPPLNFKALQALNTKAKTLHTRWEEFDHTCEKYGWHAGLKAERKEELCKEIIRTNRDLLSWQYKDPMYPKDDVPTYANFVAAKDQEKRK